MEPTEPPVIDTFVVSVPANWIMLPTVTQNLGNELDDTISGFGLEAEPAARLGAALCNVTQLAHSTSRTTRTDWALITNPASGRVDALVSIEMLLNEDAALENYRHALESTSPVHNGVELINRTVTDQELPAGPALVVHEFGLPASGDGVSEPAVERAVVALFPKEFDKAFEFVLVTQDLGLFDDASDYLIQVAAQVNSAESGSPE